MQKEHIKKKNDLMKSIMTNPKLSKTFADAMSAPIGSTKREQAKSILSIMRKVGGIHDGQGGPLEDAASGNTGGILSNTTAPNYTNMLIFPAAPTLKGLTLPNTNTPKDTGLNITGNPTAPNNSFSGIKPLEISPTMSIPGLSLPNLNSKVNSGLTQNGQPIYGNIVSSVQSSSPSTYAPTYSDTALTPGQFGPTTPIPQSTGSGDMQGPPSPNSPEGIKALQISLNTKNAGQAGWVPLATDGIMGPKTQAAMSFTPGSTTPGSNNTSGNTVGNTGGTPTPGGSLRSQAQSAVNAGTGPGLFAMGVADEKFGGSLDQYIAKLDAKLKTDFNLEPLEQQLSDLKAEKNNLVPTLTQYVQGKDQYLKFVDKMIDSTQDELLHQDMGNPAVANSYNNYLNYLYTLKGRQTQRYGNFLNSAIADYNADVEKTQSNYDTVYKRYSDAITRQGGIAQNEYNTLYQTMSDLYTNLEQAPIKQANLEALQLQNKANSLVIAQNGIDQNTVTNPKYWADVKQYGDMITDKDGNLDLTKVPSDGLIGLYYQNVLQGGDEAAMTEAIRRALAQSMETNKSDPAIMSKLKGMITTLASDPDPSGAVFSTPLMNSYIPKAQSALTGFISGQMAEVKSALNDLVSGGSGFLWTGLGARQAGIKDQAGWMKDHAVLGKEFLTDLYNAVNTSIQPGTAYATNPKLFVNQVFSGQNDQENAGNLAAIMAVSS